MFGYFPSSYFPASYFPQDYSGDVTPAPEPNPNPYLPTCYFPSSFFPGAYFGDASYAAPPSFFEADLVAYLLAQGITIYPGHVPQGVGLPAYTFFVISDQPRYTLAKAAGLTVKTIQFTAFATSFLSVVSMEKVLRNILSGFRGSMLSSFISSCRLDQVVDLYEPNVDATDQGTYQRSTEYRMFVRESVLSS
jgi:hypothetical protein